MPLDREELVRRLTATFLEELAEHVRVFNRELLSLERDPELHRAEAVQCLFRAAHSLKGAARSVNATAIALLSHNLEELLLRVRDGKRSLTPELFALLFRVSDALVEGGERFRSGVSDDPAMLELTEQIERALDEPAQSSANAPGGPTPPEAPGSLPPRSRPSYPPSERPTNLQNRRFSPFPSESPSEGGADSAPSTGRSSLPAPSLSPPAFELAEGRDRAEHPAADVERAAAKALDQGVIRVPKRRLDRLVAESAELRTARLRLDVRRGELEQLDELVQRWRNEWASARKALVRHGRRRSKMPRSGNGGAWNGTAANGSAANGAAANGAAANGVAYADGDLPSRARRLLERTAEYMRRLEQDLSRLTTGFKADQRELARAAESLENDVLGLRMERFGELADSLLRVARDVALAESKLVDLVIEGAEIEVDRSLLETLKAPLSHLIRNAIDHGIETPAERRRLGKAERSKLLVSARLRGDVVEIEVCDDGRGLDLEAIARQARAAGIALADGEDVSRLIFAHGLSTAQRVTEISGRGVGLDVVKTQLEAVNGRVEVHAERGRGARFRLELPPSLSSSRVLLVRAAGEIFALPCAGVERLARVEVKSLRMLEGKPVALLGGTPLPVLTLASVLGLPAPVLSPDARLTLVVLLVRGRRFGLGVDEVSDLREVLLKPLGRRLRNVRHVSGATILPNGRLSLILNTTELVTTASELSETVRVLESPSAVEARRRLLLVDDSMTTRTLERNILESAGYDVMAAADGRAALELLERHGADLVVSDVEMPHLDGLGLLTAIRASSRFRDLPVILLTSLEAADHRQRGLDAGADAYLVKSAFDQSRLLETIRQLL
jgi:two-component system chemotaxis sensor kinase CheA